MAFTVEVTNRALQDAREHLRYLNTRIHYQETGRRWWLHLLEAIESLGEMPQRCKIYPHEIEGQRDLRYLIFGAHRIIFYLNIEQSRVIVLRVLHAARSAQ